VALPEFTAPSAAEVLGWVQTEEVGFGLIVITFTHTEVFGELPSGLTTRSELCVSGSNALVHGREDATESGAARAMSSLGTELVQEPDLMRSSSCAVKNGESMIQVHDSMCTEQTYLRIQCELTRN